MPINLKKIDVIFEMLYNYHMLQNMDTTQLDRISIPQTFKMGL